MTRRKTLVDLKEYPTALEMARAFYREKGHLRQSKECREIADFLGMSNIAVWHAYLRGDLGVPSPNPQRAKAWATGNVFYETPDHPCRRCGSIRRKPGDDICYDCEERYRADQRRK